VKSAEGMDEGIHDGSASHTRRFPTSKKASTEIFFKETQTNSEMDRNKHHLLGNPRKH
jgi:hypothetical protein